MLIHSSFFLNNILADTSRLILSRLDLCNSLYLDIGQLKLAPSRVPVRTLTESGISVTVAFEWFFQKPDMSIANYAQKTQQSNSQMSLISLMSLPFTLSFRFVGSLGSIIVKCKDLRVIQLDITGMEECLNVASSIDVRTKSFTSEGEWLFLAMLFFFSLSLFVFAMSSEILHAIKIVNNK